MVGHHPAKFGDYRYSSSGDMMHLVVEGQDFTCSDLNLPLQFISVYSKWLESKRQITPVLVTLVLGKKPRNIKKNLQVCPKTLSRRRKRKNNCNCKDFCVTGKRNKRKDKNLKH